MTRRNNGNLAPPTTPRPEAPRAQVAVNDVRTATGHTLDAIAGTPRPKGMADAEFRASLPRCHFGPREGWCDRDGPGEFMGHTCNAPARSADLYGLITVSENGGNMLAPSSRSYTIPPPFNEDAERVAFCDWYRNTYGAPATNIHGGSSSAYASTAWSAWLARARK